LRGFYALRLFREAFLCYNLKIYLWAVDMVRSFKIIQRKNFKYGFKYDRLSIFLGVLFLSLALIGASIFVLPKMKSALRSAAPAQTDNKDANGREFNDVPASYQYASSISFLKNKGIIKGYDDNTFKPDDILKRDQLVKIIVTARNAEPLSLMHSYCFDDVKNEWFARYVCFAKTKGWVTGYDDGTFRPEKNLTEGETVSMILNGFGLAEKDLPLGDLVKTQDSGAEISRGKACEILARAIMKARLF
jgi:hypothetical protein